MPNHSQVQRRGPFFNRGQGEFREAVVNRVHWRKLGVGNAVASHWLSRNSLSLAEWLLGEKKISFFLPTRVVEQKNIFLLKVESTISLFGVIENEW